MAGESTIADISPIDGHSVPLPKRLSGDLALPPVHLEADVRWSHSRPLAPHDPGQRHLEPSGAKRTSHCRAPTSQFDPQRTWRNCFLGSPRRARRDLILNTFPLLPVRLWRFVVRARRVFGGDPASKIRNVAWAVGKDDPSGKGGWCSYGALPPISGNLRNAQLAHRPDVRATAPRHLVRVRSANERKGLLLGVDGN